MEILTYEAHILARSYTITVYEAWQSEGHRPYAQVEYEILINLFAVDWFQEHGSSMTNIFSHVCH